MTTVCQPFFPCVEQVHIVNTDDLINRNRQILNSQNASDRDISSLQNWVTGNACLSRDESAYLKRQDLFSIVEYDGPMARAEGLVEDFMIQWFTDIYQVCDLVPTKKAIKKAIVAYLLKSSPAFLSRAIARSTRFPSVRRVDRLSGPLHHRRGGHYRSTDPYYGLQLRDQLESPRSYRYRRDSHIYYHVGHDGADTDH